MRIGIVYPGTDLPTDANTVRTFIKGIEELGYSHVLVYDHVVGADPTIYQDWNGPYDIASTFHEALVFLGFISAITDMEVVTGIIIAPQRQTVLLAKQAAEVDILAGGRFRLGLGVGWNTVEYEALGQDFSSRGQRQEEQISLLRRLWTERSVTHEGRFDHVTAAGLAPLPVQRPIPIWLGGNSDTAFQRIGKFADGWFPLIHPGPNLERAQTIINEAATAADRDPADLGMEGRLNQGPGDTDHLIKFADRWRDAGATHLTVVTLRTGMVGVEAHLDAFGRAAETLQL